MFAEPEDIDEALAPAAVWFIVSTFAFVRPRLFWPYWRDARFFPARKRTTAQSGLMSFMIY
ncbi:hypothetical protein ADT71_08840 [Novosphingobium sp. ST904]|nr:hypothetical protein ADT71_08840 [Novosphingobium sp. ST904]